MHSRTISAAMTGAGRIAAVLVVPHGTHRPQALAEAIRRLHPAWKVGAVWCGDPQLRPSLGSVTWLDDRQVDAAAEVAIIAGDPLVGEWRRAGAVTSGLLADGIDQVVVLWVGATAVLGSLEPLVADDSRPMTFVVRAPEALPGDGLIPGEHDLAEAGLYSTSVAVFGSAARPALDWLAGQLNGRANVAHVLARAAQLFGANECRDETIGVGRWRWNCAEPALLDVPEYDERTPWTLDAEASKPQRVELLGNPSRQEVMARAAPQLAGQRAELCVPGGLIVDLVVRRAVADATSLPPAPWSAAAEFRDWLAPRYWATLHEHRPDLAIAFPDPEDRSAIAFQRWCREAFTVDDVPLLLAPPRVERDPVVVVDPLRTDGLNLVGYFSRQSGLGDVVRRLRDAVDQAGVPHSSVATQRTASPVEAASSTANRVEFTNSLCVVTADQFPFLAGDFPDLFAASQRMIGYWFWELEHIPLHMRRSIALVDEIWAGSRFVTDAFAAVAAIPVRHVPIPVAEPRASQRSRGDFTEVADLGDRPLLLMVFDHLSITERKNPVGVIDAFRRAFAPNEGPVLVIKTMNGQHRWLHHQRVLAAAEGRPDIRVWDETLDRADQMALVAAADVMVSLHRSEGLGLHLAESMWLRTPVIATRYSGNLDFMTDENSVLIDAQIINVEHGEGVYPPTATWAAPDLEQAAAAMRRLVDDAALAARLAVAGRRTMEQQPSLADTGRLIRQLLLGGE